jgi:hypothetical protein
MPALEPTVSLAARFADHAVPSAGALPLPPYATDDALSLKQEELVPMPTAGTAAAFAAGF